MFSCFSGCSPYAMSLKTQSLRLDGGKVNTSSAQLRRRHDECMSRDPSPLNCAGVERVGSPLFEG